MNKKKAAILLALSLLVTTVIIGVTTAAWRAGTTMDKTITTAVIDVNLHMDNEATTKEKDVFYSAKDIANGFVSNRGYVSNDGTVPFYLRLKIDRGWYDNNTKLATKGGKIIDNKLIGISFMDTDNWIIIEDNKNNDGSIYAYYKKQLDVGKKTDYFMSGYTILKDYQGNTNQYANLSVKVDIAAEAIQTIAAEKAMLKEWNITVNIDKDGNIVNISNN